MVCDTVSDELIRAGFVFTRGITLPNISVLFEKLEAGVSVVLDKSFSRKVRHYISVINYTVERLKFGICEISVGFISNSRLAKVDG